MKAPKWIQGGSHTHTTIATLLSLLAAPFSGLGVLALLFRAWVPGVVLLFVGLGFWFVGRYLIDQ